MELKTLRYKKVYNVLEKTLEIVVSVFVEEKDIDTVDLFTNYEKIVSKCLFPSNPTQSLSIYQEDGLGKRVNDLLQDVSQYEFNNIMATFAHYHIARYVDKEVLDDEVVVGINKITTTNGVVYTIRNEKVSVGLADDAEELSIEDDPHYEIDEVFRSMIESGDGENEGEKETAENGKGKWGWQNKVWMYVIVFVIVALFCSMLAVLMLRRDLRHPYTPIISGDTIVHSNSDVNSGDSNPRDGERGTDVVKKEDLSIRERGNGQDPVKKRYSDSPANPSKVNPTADKSTSVEEVAEKHDNGGVDIQLDTIGFPYGLYYGEYRTTNGKRYPCGAGIMKYNQRTTLRSTVTGWRYRYVKEGYELSGVWEGELVKCGTLFDGSAVRLVLDSVPCK